MEYWYKKREIPRAEKEKIKKLVSGEKICEIYPSDGKAVKLYKVSDDRFHRLFEINRSFLYRGDFTAPADENDYRQGYNLVTESGLAGLYVTTDGWLISVYSNEKWSGFVRLTAGLVKEKVKKVVCIVAGDALLSGLVQLYIDSIDLKAVAATIDDRERMIEYYGKGFIRDFSAHHGIPHHVFLGRKDVDVSDVKCFTDYFEALDYVNDIL